MPEPPKSREELDMRMVRALSSGGSKDIGTLAREVGLVPERFGHANAEAQNEVWRSIDRIRGNKP